MSTLGATRVLLLLPLTLLLSAGCGEPPTKEMNQAQGALDTARAAGAAEYAADELRAAETSFERSQQAATERDYRQALNYALDARDRAQTAARQAADEKARARTEADRALRAAEAALADARERLDAATSGRVPATALRTPAGELESAADTMQAARAQFEKGAYAEVVKTVEGLEARLTNAASQIDAALTARQTRRPARRNR